jgi:hypothetical protein
VVFHDRVLGEGRRRTEVLHVPVVERDCLAPGSNRSRRVGMRDLSIARELKPYNNHDTNHIVLLNNDDYHRLPLALRQLERWVKDHPFRRVAIPLLAGSVSMNSLPRILTHLPWPAHPLRIVESQPQLRQPATVKTNLQDALEPTVEWRDVALEWAATVLVELSFDTRTANIQLQPCLLRETAVMSSALASHESLHQAKWKQVLTPRSLRVRAEASTRIQRHCLLSQ